MSIFRISVDNPVLVNMLMIAVIVLGTYSFITLPREAMPNIEFNWAFILTIYPGASPEEVEQLITIPMEEEIQDVEKIDLISSESSEGASFVWVKFEQMSDDDFDKVFQDLRTEIDKVRDLPEDAEDPDVIRFNTELMMPIINVVLSGDRPEGEMKEWAKRLREDILDIEDVAKVNTSGVRARAVTIGCWTGPPSGNALSRPSGAMISMRPPRFLKRMGMRIRMLSPSATSVGLSIMTRRSVPARRTPRR